ncbi:patatin family protein [Paractinoplanes deccanensis]|uniref:Patatin family protein n=1 Tax=Paractinoplanes deccanensis TaxID=113561 RepID=A0ABQ3YJJ8_9ACTN|nr:patatin-like phospholipase family protein [Actinoplanes deccanensis]GID80173.1 patatin family protein [Actinoplanes deccanensis]
MTEMTAHWAEDHPVLEVLRERRERQSRPGRRDDGHFVALAVEGGGLRGVVSAAMLCALEDIEVKNGFDIIYSCSSGAINAAYFVGGETWYPTSIYFDDLTSKDFLDFRRILRGQSIMNLDFALGDIVGERKPLSYEAVLKSEIPVHIMVTDIDNLTTRAPADFSSAADLLSALRASMWLPLAVRGASPFRDFRGIDGGVLTAHPFLIAEKDERVTHILSLSTRPMGSTRPGVSLLNRYVGFRLDRLRAGLGRGYVDAVRTYKQARRRIEDERLHPARRPYILDLAPLPRHAEVIRHESNPWLLLEGARSGYEVVYSAVERKYRRAMLRLTVPDHNRAEFLFPVDRLNRH